MEESSEAHCVCRTGWTGQRCGIPSSLKKAHWIHDTELTKSLQLRKRVKRVIMFVPLSHEYEIFEANVNGLRDLVDVYVIGESSLKHEKASYPLLEKLKNGWLSEHQDRFVYVPPRSDLNASLAEGVAHDGLRLLSDIRPDDLLILTNGEEIIYRDVLVFLKLFQGYPLPIRCEFKQHLYGFYWKVDKGNSTTVPPVCILSVKFFANAFHYRVSELSEGGISKETRKFLNSKDQPLLDWTLDTGWRCHLCLSVHSILKKFTNLPQGVRPKWVSESPASMLPFLQRLIKFGQDENLNSVGRANDLKSGSFPPYMQQNYERFRHLLVNPYETMSIHSV